jgi:hypothetical protein
MHILYVEECGAPRRGPKLRNKYFAIGGLIVPDLIWHELRDKFSRTKERFGLGGELKWRYFLTANRSARNPMRAMNIAQRDNLLSEIYKLISSMRAVKAVACVSRLETAFQMPLIRGWNDLFYYTYKPVTERFQYFLQDESRTAVQRETGIVISGRRAGSFVDTLAGAHQRLLETRAYTVEYGNLIESVLFEPLQTSAGTELAGLVAGAIWSKYENHDARWYQMLEPILRKSKEGAVAGFGVVEFPKAEAGVRRTRILQMRP